jgi:RimJ/RimL family protein N-acetyltransferase
MEYELNKLDQPLDLTVKDWNTPAFPPPEVMHGQFCRLEPLDADRHAQSLYKANAVDVEGKNWTYLPYGPFPTFDSYRNWVEQYATGCDPQFYAIIDLTTGNAAGVASYLRIDPNNGSIEVGGINFSPLLQRKPAATEAMYLMMARAFNLGYRRYEWKCNALNTPSRAAAQRLGLSYEGVFRQATVVKVRNRDTAWYAAIDQEWPALKEAFTKWLSPSNFDAKGMQRVSLATLTAPILKQRG